MRPSSGCHNLRTCTVTKNVAIIRPNGPLPLDGHVPFAVTAWACQQPSGQISDWPALRLTTHVGSPASKSISCPLLLCATPGAMAVHLLSPDFEISVLPHEVVVTALNNSIGSTTWSTGWRWARQRSDLKLRTQYWCCGSRRRGIRRTGCRSCRRRRRRWPSPRSRRLRNQSKLQPTIRIGTCFEICFNPGLANKKVFHYPLSIVRNHNNFAKNVLQIS